jgi:phosphoinositide-3-kinase regulatory subunit 4
LTATGYRQPDYDALIADLQAAIEEQAGTLLLDASSDVKRAALANITTLCLFFGRSKTNEVLLSRMITYLNDKDWRLRCAFLESIVSVAALVGTTSLEEFVLPLMEQALAGGLSASHGTC